MDIYTLNRMGRIEHQHNVGSLRSVPEYGDPIAAKQPSWVSRQMGNLLTAFRTGQAALAKHVTHTPQITAIDRDQVTN